MLSYSFKITKHFKSSIVIYPFQWQREAFYSFWTKFLVHKKYLSWTSIYNPVVLPQPPIFDVTRAVFNTH